MIGIILLILSLIISMIGGGSIIAIFDYVKPPLYLEVISTSCFIISFVLFLLSIVFMRKNIKHISIFGVAILALAIVALVVGMIWEIDILLKVGIFSITPAFITFMYGFICDRKYQNNVVYTLIDE